MRAVSKRRSVHKVVVFENYLEALEERSRFLEKMFESGHLSFRVNASLLQEARQIFLHLDATDGRVEDLEDEIAVTISGEKLPRYIERHLEEHGWSRDKNRRKYK